MRIWNGNHKKLRGLISLVAVLQLLMPCRSFAAGYQPSQADLDWLPITRQNKPWTRWWWLGNIVNKQDLTTELEKYEKAGLGGVEITPIYGVKGYENRFIDFLSPMWVEMFEHTLTQADRLGMGVDLATGTGWPFGGPWVGDEHASKYFTHQTYKLKGGERLNGRISYVQKPVVRAVGRRVQISELKQPVTANANLQALALDQVRFEKPLPLQTLMAYSDGGETIDLTNKVDRSGTLDWTPPAGDWTLYAVFQGWHGKLVERAGPGGEGNVIDHFSAEALNHYLTKFDRAFANRNLKSLRAYFNDSYEVDDAQGEANWTPDFFAEFERRRGYDLRQHLPALLGNGSTEKNTRVLIDYRETISDLLLDEFTVPWRRWAQSKEAIMRNQSHGSPANLLDLYAASDIPETEGTDIIRMKYASSAANVTGKPLASSETATWLDEHFLSTLGDVKRAVDTTFLGGVNHICYHGTPFSPESEEYPGWLFYAAVHFGPTNSFWNDFPALNSYIARMQSFLQLGRSGNDVLLYYPVHDRWAERGESLLRHFGGGIESQMAIGDDQTMIDTGHTFDFISDRQLANVTFTGGALQTGEARYKTIVLPGAERIPLQTFEKLVGLARQGATIIVHRHMPSDVPGFGNLDSNQAALRKLVAGIKFAKVGNSNAQSAKVGGGRFLLGDDLNGLLSYAGIEREAMVDQGLKFVRRQHEDNNYYFVLNSSDKLVDGWVPLRARAKAVAIFDSMREEKGLAMLRTTDAGGSEIYLQLAPGESRILKTFNSAISGASFPLFKTKGAPQRLSGSWSVNFIEGGPELPSAVQIRELSSWTNFGGEAVKSFSGTARYTLSFAKPAGEADAWLLSLGRVAESARVRFNGRDLGTLIQAPYQVTIPRNLMSEQNTLEVAVSNLMANRIADLDRRNVRWKKFYNINFPPRRKENAGADGLFDASRWTPRESGLIGPATLAPLDSMNLRGGTQPPSN